MPDDTYETMLDMRGPGAIQMARWIATNLSQRDVDDVYIRIEVNAEDDADIPALDPTATDGDIEQPDGEPIEVSEGSRPHRALMLLLQYSSMDAGDEEGWATTGELYEAGGSEMFRDKTDLSAAISRLFNDKNMLARRATSRPNVYEYRPLPQVFVQYGRR